MAGNVENGEAPTLCWEGLEIRPDKNLDCLFTGINLDPNRIIAKVYLVASSVLSSHDGVGHYHLVLRASAHLRSNSLPTPWDFSTTGAGPRVIVWPPSIRWPNRSPKSREGLEAPDLMLGWIPMLTEPSSRGPRISRQSGLTLYAHAMRPESKGHVHITAADARRPPAINFNFLSSPPDAELTVRAVRIAREIMTAPAMIPFQMSEVAPGANRTTDHEILDWVKQAAETTYHPVGTCKMGSDPMAVVDAQLRVHGIAGLRVADASIMPTLTSGNPNAPSIMIGEKAADMVLNAPT